MKNSLVEVELQIGEKMGHVYPLYHIPEVEKARNEILNLFSICLNM